MGSRNKKKHKTERIEQEEYYLFLEDSIRKKQEDTEEFVHWSQHRDKVVEQEIEKEKENDPKYAIFKKPLEPLMPSRSYLKKKNDSKSERT